MKVFITKNRFLITIIPSIQYYYAVKIVIISWLNYDININLNRQNKKHD
jgi:hypothetical protein